MRRPFVWKRTQNRERTARDDIVTKVQIIVYGVSVSQDNKACGNEGEKSKKNQSEKTDLEPGTRE